MLAGVSVAVGRAEIRLKWFDIPILLHSCYASRFEPRWPWRVMDCSPKVTDSASEQHRNSKWVPSQGSPLRFTIDGTVISDGSTLEGWSSPTEFNPIDVEGYTVRIVAYDSSGHDVLTGRGHGHGHVGDAWIATVPLNSHFAGHLRRGALRCAIGSRADVVSVLVTYHDSTEQVQQYAPYRLWVNGWLQPGG